MIRISISISISIVAALMAVGCLRQTEYRCSDDVACSGGGTCELSGFCSFPTTECASGRGYGASAGNLANTCVEGEQQMIDASITIDAPLSDAPKTDAPTGGCPGNYAAIAGGQPGHVYRVVMTSTDWAIQVNACAITSPKAYLAIPDDANELLALDTLIGVGATYWVGISDLVTEMQWRTVLDTAQTFLPWLAPAPDDQNPGEDCVAAIAALHQFDDDRCNNNHPAICECAP
jgi:hypothetical protein